MDSSNFLIIFKTIEDDTKADTPGVTKTVQRDKAKKLKPLGILEKEGQVDSKMTSTEDGKVLVEANYLDNAGIVINNRITSRSDTDQRISKDL
jgi:hypothetical protein